MKNWKTNLVGIALIIAGLYTGIFQKATWTEASIIIGIGAGFFFTKDFNVTGK